MIAGRKHATGRATLFRCVRRDRRARTDDSPETTVCAGNATAGCGVEFGTARAAQLIAAADVDCPGCSVNRVSAGGLSYRSAKELCAAEHHPQCIVWLAAAAYLSADLEDED